MPFPIIGISVDNLDNTIASGKYEIGTNYSRLITNAGGVPILLPHEPQLASQYARLCQGFVLSGGVDPRTEVFGQPTHARTRPLDPRRQAFELALLEQAQRDPHKPVLGVCLGMQLMALRAGGRLDQYLPESFPQADVHSGRKLHGLVLCATDSALAPEDPAAKEANLQVVSHHQQAVADPGSLRVVARSSDGLIEAIDDPNRPFYLGVQWHPERGGEGMVNDRLLNRFVDACRGAS